MTLGESLTLSKSWFLLSQNGSIPRLDPLGSYQLFHSAVRAAGTKATRSPAGSPAGTRAATTQNSCCLINSLCSAPAGAPGTPSWRCVHTPLPLLASSETCFSGHCPKFPGAPGNPAVSQSRKTRGGDAEPGDPAPGIPRLPPRPGRE